MAARHEQRHAACWRCVFLAILSSRLPGRWTAAGHLAYVWRTFNDAELICAGAREEAQVIALHPAHGTGREISVVLDVKAACGGWSAGWAAQMGACSRRSADGQQTRAASSTALHSAVLRGSACLSDAFCWPARMPSQRSGLAAMHAAARAPRHACRSASARAGAGLDACCMGAWARSPDRMGGTPVVLKLCGRAAAAWCRDRDPTVMLRSGACSMWMC